MTSPGFTSSSVSTGRSFALATCAIVLWPRAPIWPISKWLSVRPCGISTFFSVCQNGQGGRLRVVFSFTTAPEKPEFCFNTSLIQLLSTRPQCPRDKSTSFVPGSTGTFSGSNNCINSIKAFLSASVDATGCSFTRIRSTAFGAFCTTCDDNASGTVQITMLSITLQRRGHLFTSFPDSLGISDNAPYSELPHRY